MRKELEARSQGKCELTGWEEDIVEYAVPPKEGTDISEVLAISQKALNQILGNEELIPEIWRKLPETVWSEVPAIKVLSYRTLHLLQSEAWAKEALDIAYVEEEEKEWALYGLNDNSHAHIDSNGAVLNQGDSVVLIKDLDVKGANFTAKRGTAVRNITLVHDNPEHIEGKVNGQKIVILTKFVKKS